MNETEPATRQLPAGRYGKQRTSHLGRKNTRLALGALAIAIGVALAYIAYLNLGDAPISAERIGFSERPGNAMEITINVTKDDESRPAVCIVRVRDRGGAESGRREVLVPAGNNGRPLRTVIQ
ncbi:MAG: DUF4307 domain-containing protein, partial [Thermocrispum sp.]